MPGDLGFGWEHLPLPTRQLMADLSEANGAEAVLATLRSASADALAKLTYLEVRGYDLRFDGYRMVRNPKGPLDANQMEEACAIVGAHCPDLLRVHVDGACLTPAAAQSLANLPKLEQAEFFDTRVDDPGALQGLAGCKNLRNLSLDGPLPEEGVSALAVLSRCSQVCRRWRSPCAELFGNSLPLTSST